MYTVLSHEAVPVGITGTPGHLTCPLFTSESTAGIWLMNMGLEQHIVSRPLAGRMLVEFLEHLKDNGYSSVGVNPPSQTNVPFQAAPLDYFIEQATDKAAS
jgi:hypothetical protein